jgi:hypothetical protein
LPEALEQAGIDCTHAAGLGGLQRRRAGSVNTGRHNVSFGERQWGRVTSPHAGVLRSC